MMKFCLLFTALFFSGVNAISLEVNKSSLVSDKSLWKPRALHRFSDVSFCFAAEEGGCEKNCPQKVLCSFDDGKSFKEVSTTLPFCENGVVSEDKLFCRSKINATSYVGQVIYTTHSFTCDEYNQKLIENANETKTFTYFGEQVIPNMTNVVDISKYVSLNDSRPFMKPQGTWCAVGSADTETEDSIPVLFTSQDGFTWNASSRLDITPGEKYSVSYLGKNTISVASHYDNQAEVVSSKYAGKYWSKPYVSNITFPPATLVLPTGVVYHHGISKNSTEFIIEHFTDPELGANLTVNGTVDLRQLLQNPEATSSGHILLFLDYNKNRREIFTIFDSNDGSKYSLHFVSYSIEDLEEVRAHKARLAKKRKLEQERHDREEKERVEAKRREEEAKKKKKRRAEERRKKFNEADKKNIDLAWEKYRQNEPFVVVRRIIKGMENLEKDTYFPEIILWKKIIPEEKEEKKEEQEK